MDGDWLNDKAVLDVSTNMLFSGTEYKDSNIDGIWWIPDDAYGIVEGLKNSLA